ncbi:hypothetical protein ACFO9Q_19360 [Paenibacillus sp. GCM10023252]|uniref:hypothetical protein n=1 Tax=Paenibacillus sp. GCM10023252 TaxID=3252649 RepID=UPI0036087E6A
MHKNAIAALLLSVIPGVGHGYLGRPIRTIIYGGGFLFLIFISFFMAENGGEGDEVAIFLAFSIWAVNGLDMIISLANGVHKRQSPYPIMTVPVIDPTTGEPLPGAQHLHHVQYEHQREKSQTILLSIIPGLGHMALGLMQRGLTFLITFIGLFAIIVFVASITHTEVFLIFLFILPVVWIYSMFDAIQQVHRKQRGEEMNDRAMFEDLEEHVASGRKNKVLAIALSIFPGAGHLYLGLQMRGLQLMGGFLLAIYLMDSLRLSLFLFLLPLFWFYAFFDALQQMSRYERETAMSDAPIVAQFAPYQRWIGLGLLVLGIYYLGDRVVADYISESWPGIYQEYINIRYKLPTAVVSFIMIALGFRLVFGRKAAGASVQPPASTPAPTPAPAIIPQREEERS